MTLEMVQIISIGTSFRSALVKEHVGSSGMPLAMCLLVIQCLVLSDGVQMAGSLKTTAKSFSK